MIDVTWVMAFKSYGACFPEALEIFTRTAAAGLHGMSLDPSNKETQAHKKFDLK